MIRISRLPAESLSDAEFHALKSLRLGADSLVDISPQVLDVLSHLRLTSPNFSASCPRITSLGNSVLGDRIERSLQAR